MFKLCTVTLIGILLTAFAAGPAVGQSDPFGTLDVVHIDSVKTSPGADILVRFNVRNDEPLGSLSIPVVYDPTVLTLQAISFAGSRVAHLNTKIYTPGNISQINGHFVVAAIQMYPEAPIAAGDGTVFTAQFKVNNSAALGTITLIDSLFYAPGGELVLVGLNSGGGSAVIHPKFEAGKVVVAHPNRAPIFAALADQYVMEGDTLDLPISVTDPDQDNVTLAITSKPAGARFIDNGNGSGRLVWAPEYVGPNSADGSPFTVGLWAGDGVLSSERQLVIHVVNTNRAPVITAPQAVTIEAGQTVAFAVTAFDPDFENVTWRVAGLPKGAQFDFSNPGTIAWQSHVTDTGNCAMQFVASDPNGLADTVSIPGTITAVALYRLQLDSVEVYPGETFEFGIKLNNQLPVGSCNILFRYDPSALTLLSVSNTGTRTEGFEYFNVGLNDNGVVGNVRLIAVADNGGGGLPLAAGQGNVAVCRFRTSSDLAYAGMSLQVRFLYEDAPINNDNTLTDSIDVKITQQNISYVTGNVMIHDIGQIRIGDINLNGLAAEIGDIIYFTNYFINPILYSFNALQYANSDVNRDNIAATVSDLVALINIVVNGTPAGKSADLGDTVTAVIEHQADRTVFGYDAEFEMGAALFVLETDGDLNNLVVTSMQEQMTVDYRKVDGRVNILVSSLTGRTMPSGKTDLFSIKGLADYRVSRIEMGSADGRNVQVALVNSGGGLPTTYSLEQNYPNPFNPETQIEFSLPQAATVELTVYNVLGQQVRQLAAGELPAGRHTLTWDGTDDGRQTVASGVYLYRLAAGNHVFTRKMMLLK
jgi:hypothetical protein